MKFKKGEKVRVKKNLIIGEMYFNEDHRVYDVFSYGMREYLGKEGVIIGLSKGKYVLDFGKIYGFTDDMLEYPVDNSVKAPYRFDPEVEELLFHVMKEHYIALIDKALDNDIYVKNPSEFQKLVDLYKKYI